MRYAYLCTILLIAGQLSAPAAYPMEITDNIRVSVLNNVNEIELSIRGAYTIQRVDTGAVIDQGNTFFNRKIKPFSTGISFGNRNFNVNAIHIIPKKQPAVYLDKRLYRGSLQVINTKTGKLTAINIVDIEEYLKGVLYHEVSHRWPIEAIKAQAIASRTYALYQIQENRHKHYDLYSDISSQVYNGFYAERYRTNNAVDQTMHQVLVWKGKPVPAFFHSTCAGHTEKAGNLWKIDIAPLAGVKCAYCKNSPYFTWSCELQVTFLEKSLKQRGYIIDAIDAIKPSRKNPSGRVENIMFQGFDLSETLKAKDFRQLIGPSFIKSTNFDVSIKDEKAYFQGKGWGHGVGMCQWGAFAMAKQRYTAEEILSYYYPGAKVAVVK
jgi:stage II sporulation protein D